MNINPIINKNANFRYPGSRPFDDTEIERRLFFGREQEKEDLLHKVLTNNLVVLYSKSGIGKTSLINAGINQALRDNGFLPLIIRFNIPQYDPCNIIYRSIIDITGSKKLDFKEGEKNSLRQYFKTSMFWSENETLLKPVLIFDQFEEFFDRHSLESRKEFISQIADIVNNRIPDTDTIRKLIQPGESFQYNEKPPNVKIIISLREDFLGQLEEMSHEIPDIFNNRFKLFPLTYEQAKAAINKPAQVKDKEIHTEPFEYSPDTVNMMLDFLYKRNEKGGIRVSNEVESFQLQLLCRHIEDKVREETTKRNDAIIIEPSTLGGEKGMQQILQQFYSDSLNRLDSFQEKKKAYKLFEKGLINFDDRRLSLEENEIERNYHVSKDLLTKLVDYRVVRSEPRLGSVYYELSHDSLITPIRLTQQKRRTKLEKYAILLVPFIIAAIIILLMGGNSKKNNLAFLLNEADQLAFDSKDNQAIEKYNQILKVNPKNIKAIVKLGELLRKVGKNEEAIQLYKKAIDKGITDARVYNGWLNALAKVQSEDEGISYLNDVIIQNPRKTEAYEALGDYYGTAKQYELAIDNYEKVLSLNNKMKAIYEKLAVLYVDKGEAEKAITTFERAIEINAEFARIYQKIRDSLQQKNDTKTIEALYKIAFQAKSKNANYYLGLGSDYYALRDYKDAIASYQKAIDINPNFNNAYMMMGLAQSHIYDYDAAIISYRKALKIKPNDVRIYIIMAVAQNKNEDYNAEINSYKKVLTLKPNYAEVYNSMGVAQSNIGDYDNAIVSFQKAMKLKPTFTEAYMNMAFIQNAKGDYDAAIASCKKALELNPDNANLYNHIGLAQKNKRNYAASLENFQKALEIEPTYLYSQENSAELYMITKHFDKAIDMAYMVLKRSDVPQDQILAMKSVIISSLFFQGNQNGALRKLQQLIIEYRGLPNDFKHEWDYQATKEYIKQSQRLNVSAQSLLLKMIDILEARIKESDEILMELEKMVREFK